MEENQLSPEDAQQIWNEEAAKLDAGDTPAVETQAAAPETPQIDVQEPQVQEPEQAPEPEQAKEPEQPEDPLAGLSPAVRAKLAQIDELAQANAQLLHHVKTAEGRVAAMQREFQQARAAQTAVAPQEAPTQGQIATAAKTPEKWEQLKQDFPEWAGAMEEYVASQLGNSRPQQGQQALDPQAVAQFVHQQVAQTKAEMQRLVEEARIEGKHDNWRDTVNSTEFAQWFAVQSPETRSLADSHSARDAIRMLDLFSEAKSVLRRTSSKSAEHVSLQPRQLDLAKLRRPRHWTT